MSFFSKNLKDYHEFTDESKIGLRKCQLGAIWAIKSHFTVTNDPALLSLPTGSGKTALMMALAFELKSKNILIITPSRVIRHQTANKFSKLDDLRNIGVYFSDNPSNPKVEEQIGYISTKEKWHELIDEFDVVVSTPNSCSPHMKLVASPGTRLFDTIFIDEAHHTGSEIYKSIIHTFKGSRIILLTATPFRRDKKRIPGHLIYHYPVSKAIEDGIYRIVDYKPINTSSKNKSKDEILAKNAIALFKKELKVNPDAKVLIKTNSIEKADYLMNEIYHKLELNVEVIHSKKNDSHNNNTIEKCRSGELSGIICVGMLGEGLDIPTLKIAVLHSTPQTLPETIQFIGRFSRITRQSGNAILIADPDTIQGEVRELYKYDDGWAELIPALIERKISHATYIGKLGNKEKSDLNFSKDDIRPFHSVTIYKLFSNFKVNTDYKKSLPSNTEYYILEHSESEPIIIITSYRYSPPWIDNELLSTVHFDIHIYYRMGNYLFEHTSSELHSNKIRSVLFNSNSYLKAGSETISKGLRDSDGHYIMIGMENVTGGTNSVPKYKTYMGSNIENSLRNADGRFFTAGHALSKIGKETRGIAKNSSKIWAIKRSYLTDFVDWCNHLFILIDFKEKNIEIPRIGMLIKTEYINLIPEQPISVIFDDLLLLNADVKVYLNKKMPLENPEISILINKYSLQSNAIYCTIKFDNANKIGLIYSPNKYPYWTQKGTDSISLNISASDNHVKNYTLEDFLNEHSPLIILKSGKSIKKNILFTPKVDNERFNRNLFNPFKINWDDTDIFNESKPIVPGSKYMYNVQDKVLSIIIKKMSLKDIIVIDDSSGEVADIIWFENGTTNKRISLIHCKFKQRSKKTDNNRTPNANKLNITELIDQGLRCGIYVKSPKLVSHLIGRIENTKSSHLCHCCKNNNISDLDKMFNPNDWLYRIVLVQPGLSKRESLKTIRLTNIEKLLVTLFDRTTNIDAELEIWANE